MAARFVTRVVQARRPCLFLNLKSRSICWTAAMSQPESAQPKGEDLPRTESRTAVLRVRALLAQHKSDAQEGAGWDAAWLVYRCSHSSEVI